jgi:hypothetical protein
MSIRSVINLFAAALLVAFSTMGHAQVILYEQTNVQIPKGAFTSPALPLPSNLTTNEVDVSVTAENWPSGGVDVSLLASFDGGQTYVTVYGPQTIQKPLVDKAGVLPPVRVGFSWGASVPTHFKAQTTSPSRFSAADLQVVSPQ